MKVVPFRKFGDRLQEAIDAAGRKQADLARLFDITPQAIQWWVRRKNPPALEITKWFKLSEFLNINLEWLCLGVGLKGRVHMTERDFDFLRRFQMLDNNQQEIVNTTINTFLSQRGDVPSFPEGKRR